MFCPSHILKRLFCVYMYRTKKVVSLIDSVKYTTVKMRFSKNGFKSIVLPKSYFGETMNLSRKRVILYVKSDTIKFLDARCLDTATCSS